MIKQEDLINLSIKIELEYRKNEDLKKLLEIKKKENEKYKEIEIKYDEVKNKVKKVISQSNKYINVLNKYDIAFKKMEEQIKEELEKNNSSKDAFVKSLNETMTEALGQIFVK